MATLNNKWVHGKTTFVLPPLPAQFQSAEGIVPWNVVLDPKTGSETVLLLFDRSPFVHDLVKVRPFDLRLKSGLVRTSHGPFFFLLFYIPNPTGSDPLIAIDAHVNAHDPQHMLIWRDLARQSHWHLVMVGSNDELVDLFEFENTFGLGQTLDQVQSICAKVPGGSFDDAKAEFRAKYAVTDLLAL